MSYQVLARKYRPQSFEDVAGQGAVVQTLRRALDTGRVAHAFLFTGSRGVGKTTLARILARCLVCDKGVSSSPCGTCALCTGVREGRLPDVVEIDGASNNGVEQIRDLQEVARYLPQVARFKIFIIDEVHMLSTSAFNALLKILEEPPPHLKFIFATTEPHKIPVTVLSRCQRYDFRRLPQKTLIERLKTVLAAEGVSLSEGGLDVIARAAEGGMRDALSLTDQVLSFAGEGATAEQVEEALGIIDRRSVVEIVDAALSRDAKRALAVIESAHSRGHDPKQLLTAVSEELRNLSVGAAVGSVQGLVDLPDDEIGRIDARAKALDGRDVTRLLGMALDALDPLVRSEDPRLHVELALLRMCTRAPLGDALLISEALVRLEALAKGRPVPPLAKAISSAEGAQALELARAAVATSRPPPEARPPTPAPAAPKAAPAAPPATLAAAQAPPASSPRAVSPPPTPRAISTPPTPVQDALLNEDEDPPLVSEVIAATEPTAPVDVEDGLDTDEPDPADELPLVGIDPRWRAFVDRVAKTARPIAMHLDHAQVGAVKEDKGAAHIEIFFVRDLHEKAVSPVLQDPVVRDALTQSYGKDSRLQIAKPASTASAQPSLADARRLALEAAQAALEAHAKSHPVVEKAVALFGGEVRAVRRR